MIKNDAISRSALMDFARNHVGSTVDVNDIARFPALDVAPVVWCKDCVYARPLNFRELMVFDRNCLVCTSKYGAGTSYPEYEMTGKVVFQKSFCYYGHKRTNGW